MNLNSGSLLRLQFLARVVAKECKHLATTNQRLFADALTLLKIKNLENDIELAERVEAFVGRFGRLQDTVGDKLLPALLATLGEKTSSMVDNLGKAERLSFIQSAEAWMVIRNLRNQMVHEYVEDMLILHEALNKGHEFVPVLIEASNSMIAEIEKRGWK